MKTKSTMAPGELRPEYKRSDFGTLTRGKYLKKVQAASNIVLLDPDVAKLFPNAPVVNDVLRSVAELARRMEPRP